MKFTKKCIKNTKPNQSSIINSIFKRRSSADRLYTSSSVSAVTSLILMVALSFLSSAFLNITGLTGANTYADSISMTVSTDNLTINMAPMSSSGEFAKSANMNIAVSTTSSSGYNLSIASSTGNTNLTSGSNSITSISSAISESTFSSSSTYNNKWGYKPSNLYNSSTEQIVTNTDFRPLPGTAGEIIAKTKCANGTSPCTNPTDTYTLSIGTRANSQTKPGNYTNDTFVIMATSNTPPKIYMQGMTADVCLAEPTLAYDSRDEAEYEVAMLRDGSCWMIENLRLGADGSQVTLTSEDSDVVNQFQFTSSADWSNTFTSANVNTAQAYYSGNINLGSYYNWYTATAGTGNSSTAADVEASGSICPKGWVLPNRVEYLNLVVNYNANKDNLLSPETPGYTIVGYYRDAEHRQSDYAVYTWERTAKSATSGDNFFINNNTGKVVSTDGMNKYYGMPMRCRLGGNVSSFTVSFNANGGTGTMSSQSTTSGTLTLNPNAFTRSGYKFAGWSTDPNATEPTYQDGGTIVSYTSALNLYAVWHKLYAITFTMDSNVSSIAVLDSSGSTVGTITSSGQSLTLVPGDTYTIKPTHTTGYGTNTITKASGAGTLSGKQFTVGAGIATISVTSKPLSPMQNFNCSSLAQGDTEEVYDTRDNEVYLIAKLADNNCWMLDNLRLDLGDSTVLNNTTSSNTNASDTYLSYLKNGGGSTSDKYPTAAVSYWTSSYSYSAPLVAIKNASDDSWNPDTVASVTYGEGSGKIGVYYNYCAASAGSYCWGNGTSYSGSPTSDPNTSSLRDIDADICPKGWRMPTSKSSGEYQALYGSYSSASEGQAEAFRNALSTPLSGYFDNGSAYNQGSDGGFWSSTWYATNYMSRLRVYSGNVDPSSNGSRDYGRSLRCVLGS